MQKFTYNEDQASQIGGGQYITKSGGYDFKITRAEFSFNDQTKGESLELDLEDREGLKCNYISINFIKNNGEQNEFGQKMIQAIMGCVGVQGLSNNNGQCAELSGRYLKGVVQRVDYTKSTGANAGQDGYKFDFKLPANIKTGKTVKETRDNSEAKSFDSYASSITDKDERSSSQNMAGSYQQAPKVNPQEPTIDFDDDIPF